MSSRRHVEISESLVTDHGVEAVWDFVENYDNDVLWRRGVVEMEPTPAGRPTNGTSVHEVVRMFGSTYTTDSVVVSTGDRAYRFEGHGTSGHVEGGRAVTQEPDGRSRFTYRISLHLEGAIGLAAPIVRTVMARRLRNDLSRLRTRLTDAGSVPVR